MDHIIMLWSFKIILVFTRRDKIHFNHKYAFDRLLRRNEER